MTLWYDEVFLDEARYGLRVLRTLFSQRSEYQHVDVVETALMGRALALDGVFQTSEGDEFFYHEMLVHPAMMTAPRIGRVLVVGGGDGGTAREVLRFPEVEEVVMVELDPLVVEVCREHLPSIGASAWTDSRLRLVYGDGVAMVADAEPASFDVVIVDSSDPVGPAEGLFGERFMASCRRALRSGGVLAMQSATPLFYGEAFYRVVRGLRRVFGAAFPYFGSVPIYASGMFTWSYGSDTTRPRAWRAERFGAIEASCRYYNEAMHHASFALPSFVQRELKRREAAEG